MYHGKKSASLVAVFNNRKIGTDFINLSRKLLVCVMNAKLSD